VEIGYSKPTPKTLLNNEVRGSKCSNILSEVAFSYPVEGKQASLYSSSTDNTQQRGALCA